MRPLIKSTLAVARKRYARKEGQTLVEYAILLAIISVIAIGVFALLSSRISIIFSVISNILDTAQSSH